MSVIGEYKIVTVKYDLYVGDEKPELMEQATDEHPLVFCFGAGNMLPKFEENLKGLKAGDTFDFVIDHIDAYGEYDDESVLELARSVFEVDGKFDAEVVKEGNIIPLMDADGNHFNASVVKVTETNVTVDLNHPLSGENLHFVGTVAGVRDASAEELEAAMHPHHHCNGNCGGDCGGDCGHHHDHDHCDGDHCCGKHNK